MITSSFIHVTAQDIILFFSWLSSIPFYILHIFFIHSSVGGHLGCVHVLTIVNSAALSIGIHVTFWIIVLSGHIPNSEIAIS